MHPFLLKTPGIRTKLIRLFVLIKVVPLVLLALLAWEGITHLGNQVSENVDVLSRQVRHTIVEMGMIFSKETENALNDRVRAEMERLTTDTAREVANFLHSRDQDIVLASELSPSTSAYRNFLAHRTRNLVPAGEWRLSEDEQSWLPVSLASQNTHRTEMENSGIPESGSDNNFHYRPAETVLRNLPAPLFHEITFISPDGMEKVKVTTTNLLSKDLRNISRKENTYAKAETYFEELKKLKPGEIYVSEVIGPYVPSRILGNVIPKHAKALGIPFEPEKEANAGRENPVGKPFQGIIRWATPVVKNGHIEGYVTLAMDHAHIMRITNNVSPTEDRYVSLPDASQGNYAAMWDYKNRAIAHPRHQLIVGFDPETGEYVPPRMDTSIYEAWQKTGKPLKEYLTEIPTFHQPENADKPSEALTKIGYMGADCRYQSFAPQCAMWNKLTQQGGSGSFFHEWEGITKLSSVAAIPYYSGKYSDSPRGFGYVTVSVNINDFQKPAKAASQLIAGKILEFDRAMDTRQSNLYELINTSITRTTILLTICTLLMILVVVAITIWLASWFTKHLMNLIKGLGRIEAGDYTFRFPYKSRDELGVLSDSLNRMAGSIQESIERKEQARIDAEEANLLKSDFLARMSHELRTPLNGILGFSELMKLDASSESIRDQAEAIHHSGEHLLQLVNDILDLAKIEAGHMCLDAVPMNLQKILEETTTLHRNAAVQKNLALTLLMEPGLPTQMTGDPTRLRQVINNLLHNAIKFTSSGSVNLVARREGNHVLLEVSDTGPGIPQNALKYIFQKFYQATNFNKREHGGTGLGLALVKEFVTLMGGDISLESPPGGGTRFTIRLPIEQEQNQG